MSDEVAFTEIKRKSGTEPFHLAGEPVGFTALNYWQWAASDFLGNTERAVVAEFIVAMDLGLADGVRISWDSFDLRTLDKHRIEVKSSAYVPSWHRTKPSKIVFGIQRARAWDWKTNTMAPVAERNSDVYVFCVLAESVRSKVDPMDLSQWEFYVLSTTVLDSKVSTQKTIGLANVKRLGAIKAQFGEISAAIAKCRATDPEIDKQLD